MHLRAYIVFYSQADSRITLIHFYSLFFLFKIFPKQIQKDLSRSSMKSQEPVLCSHRMIYLATLWKTFKLLLAFYNYKQKLQKIFAVMYPKIYQYIHLFLLQIMDKTVKYVRHGGVFLQSSTFLCMSLHFDEQSLIIPCPTFGRKDSKKKVLQKSVIEVFQWWSICFAYVRVLILISDITKQVFKKILESH